MDEKLIVKTRKIPKQTRAIETSNFVLQATAQFLQKHDYAKLSTNKVAELAGVSIGTLYQYFSSKEEVMLALIYKQLDEDFCSIQNILEGEFIQSFEEAVQKITGILISMFSEQTQLRLVIYSSKEFLMTQARESFQKRVRRVILDNFEKYSQGAYEHPTELSMSILTNAVVGTLLAAARDGAESLRQPEFECQLARLILGYFEKTISG